MTLCFRRFLTVMTIFVSCSALAADMGSKVTARRVAQLGGLVWRRRGFLRIDECVYEAQRG
jgi:hypothetical protein